MEPTSNRTTSATNPVRTLVFDNSRNTLSDSAADGSGYAATYNLRGQMAALRKGGVTAAYTYDADGRRVCKVSSTGPQSAVVFVYDLQGQLLGESDRKGVALRECVWLENTPVAMFTPDPANPGGAPLVYYLHTDHLEVPRIVVDRNNQVRWRWLAEPFGTTAPEVNPSGLGIFTQNLRFPGQYADQESGLCYNYARYYGPDGGRYTQSNPSGLDGGINTYGYVEGKPLPYVDIDGRQASLAWCFGGPAGCVAGVGLAAATMWMATNTGRQSSAASSTTEKKCCTTSRRFYSPNSGKHTSQGKWVRGKWWGRAPDDVPAAIALQTAIPLTEDESVLVGVVGHK